MKTPCKCRTDIEAQLIKRAEAEYPNAEDHCVELQGYGFAIVGQKLLCLPLMPYVTAMKVAGKGGIAKTKKVKSSMIFSFCPFCGVNLKQEVAKTKTETDAKTKETPL